LGAGHGSILGTITDNSGAVIVGAVVVTNVSTNVSRETMTNGAITIKDNLIP
jgi:hypothetical protein